MSSVVHHLVARGFEAAQDHINDYNNNYNGWSIETEDENGVAHRMEPDGRGKMPIWGGPLLLVTVMAYLFITFIITYTLELLLTTLATVETPSYTPIALPLTSSGASLLGDDAKGQGEHAMTGSSDLALVKNKPITSKIRTTIKHLKAVAGPWSYFRGLQVAFIYTLSYQVIFFAFKLWIPPSKLSGLLEVAAAVFTHVLLTRWSMTWTHRVISLPVDQPWYRRYATRRSARKAILPVVAWAAAEQIATYFPRTLYHKFNLGQVALDPEAYWNSSYEVQRMILLKLYAVLFVALGLMILVVLPARVTLVRVQASLLPEEDQPIVPFDRTFGGKVIPESEGGKGVVGILDAWTTFDRSSRLRLLGLYAKIMAVQVATTFAFVGLLIAELRIIVGAKKFDESLMKAAAAVTAAAQP